MEYKCEGCRVYGKNVKKCTIFCIPHISKTQHCPCLNCLIKGICNRICDDFKAYEKVSRKITI